MGIIGTILVILIGLGLIIYGIGTWFLNDAFSPGNSTPRAYWTTGIGLLVALSPLVI